MSFLNLDLSDTKEFTSVKAGEYKLRILKAEVKISNNTGGEYLSVLMDIPAEPLSKNINHTLMFPTTSDDIKQANNRKLAFIRFLTAFGYDPSTKVDLEAMEGSQGWAILTEKDEGEYGLQNRVKQFIVPKA